MMTASMLDPADAGLGRLFRQSADVAALFRAAEGVPPGQAQSGGALPFTEAELAGGPDARILLQRFDFGVVILWIGPAAPAGLSLVLAGGSRTPLRRCPAHDLDLPHARAWAWPSDIPPARAWGLAVSAL